MQQYPIAFENDDFRLRTLPTKMHSPGDKYDPPLIKRLADSFNFVLPYHIDINGESDKRWLCYVLEVKVKGSNAASLTDADVLHSIYEAIQESPPRRHDSVQWDLLSRTLSNLKQTLAHEGVLVGQAKLTTFPNGALGIKMYLPGGWELRHRNVGSQTGFNPDRGAWVHLKCGNDFINAELHKRCGVYSRQYDENNELLDEIQRYLDVSLNPRLKDPVIVEWVKRCKV